MDFDAHYDCWTCEYPTPWPKLNNRETEWRANAFVLCWLEPESMWIEADGRAYRGNGRIDYDFEKVLHFEDYTAHFSFVKGVVSNVVFKKGDIIYPSVLPTIADRSTKSQQPTPILSRSASNGSSGSGRYSKDQELILGYGLKGFLGKGGFGEVWRAQAPDGVSLGLKIINLFGAPYWNGLAALRQLKTIRHSNLVPVFESWILDGNSRVIVQDDGEKTVGADALAVKNVSELVIAMSLCDKSLADRLEECKEQGKFGIPIDELLDYLEGAARAIDFLNRPMHDLGSGPVAVQHCNIKPRNLLVVGDACQVSDFGLARVLDQQDKGITALGGSPAYSAPELLLGKPPVETTDQYSLAISYVELRTGFLPFDETGSTLAGVINAHIKGKLELLRLGEVEAEIIRKATALDPKQRYASCLAMIEALRKVVGGSGPNTKSANEATQVTPMRSYDLIHLGKVTDYPGSVCICNRSVSASGGGGGGETTYATADPLEVVLAFYEQKLGAFKRYSSAASWSFEESTDSGSSIQKVDLLCISASYPCDLSPPPNTQTIISYGYMSLPSKNERLSSETLNDQRHGRRGVLSFASRVMAAMFAGFAVIWLFMRMRR